MTASNIAAASLHHRFQPPRLDRPQGSKTYTTFTHISSGQVTEMQHRSSVLPTRWSIHNDLNDDLICALEGDLENLFKTHPQLFRLLSDAVERLHLDWTRVFGEDAPGEHPNEEMSTESSRILVQFAVETANSMLGSFNDSGLENPLRYRPKPTDVKCFEIDRAVVQKLDNSYRVCIENKRPMDLPEAAEDLVKRGNSCRVVDVDVETGFKREQPNWWIVANKGALYSAAYNVDWVIFAGTTVYMVGYRLGYHMLWSPPFYNRRDAEDEFQGEDSLQLLNLAFPRTTRPPAQYRLHLLFLAVVLKSMMRGFSSLDRHFPKLHALTFEIPPGEPNQESYESTGRDHQAESDDSSAHSGDHGDKSADYSPSSGGSSSDTLSSVRRGGDHGSNVNSARTTIISGSLILVGDWRGCLASPAGYSIILGDVIAAGAHGVVHEGTLLQDGVQLSVVAVKKSDIMKTLADEFSVYQQLEPNCPYIPRCYGLCISFGTAFLVTQFAQSRILPQPYGLMPKSDRGAVYAALRCVHRLGWMHNDFIDHSDILRNLLWSTEGTPMIIDLVTAQRHRCNGHCSELVDLKRALQLRKHDINIWARVRTPTMPASALY